MIKVLFICHGSNVKVYDNEKELHAMGQFVSGYLDFAERQAFWQLCATQVGLFMLRG